MKTLKSLVTVSALSLSSLAAAWNGPMPLVEHLSTKGDCQDVEASFNMDKNQIEYDFYDYEAYTDVYQGQSRTRARCTVKVPVQVPYGYQVAVSAAILEYSGYVADGGQGHTAIRYRFEGQSSEGITKSFPQGELSDDDSRIVFAPSNPSFSDCGNRKPVLELVSTITVRAPLDGGEDSDVSFEQGFSTFKQKHFANNHFDFAHKLIFRKCH